MQFGMGCRRVPCVLTLAVSAALAAATPARAGDATVVGTATATAPSARWLAVEAPLTGDDNRNGYTTYELATSAAGPFDSAGAGWTHLPGPGEWRSNDFARGSVAPGATYFVKVTWFDPDGVVGTNPQIVGPVTTPASSPNAVTVGAASAEARDEEIFVSVPIADDADLDSFGTVDVATGPGGPWTRRCGSTFDRNLPFHPKRCRIRSLVPGTDYWVRVTILDDDGVSGANPKVLGPIRYAGVANLALGKPISADPGWGCCPSPSHLVDGRIQNDAWFFGFAWTGGASGWAGGAAGFKQATVDLGAPTTFDRAATWYHDPSSVPLVWKFQASDDGSSWTDLASRSEPICRGASVAFGVGWYLPSCAHAASFPPVTARYLRFTFDDRTLFGGLHGWAVELEVFDTSSLAPPNRPPVADAGPGQTLAAGADCTAAVTLDGGASSDPDGDALDLTWTGPFGSAGGVSPTVSLPLGTHVVTLTADDGNGGSASDTVEIVVRDETPPEVVSAAASPALLWPPDHRMAPVAVKIVALDLCSAAPVSCRLTAVASDEPVNGTGDGDAAPDWLLTGDLTAELRAERAGGGDGRTYTLAAECVDEAGNAAVTGAAVAVPHDRGNRAR